MAKIEDPRQRTVAAIFDRYVLDAAGEGHRSHLGASLIGRECSRAIWYSFRWTLTEQFDGRMLRLFERGHREETWLLDDLTAIGCEVHAVDVETGAQHLVSFHGGHFGGSADGIVRGLAEAPKTWHVFECKTASAKRWAEIARKGVRVAKPEHYAQMQVYMHGLGLERAAYFVVNKDDDQIYYERVEYDRQAAELYLRRAKLVIESNEPLTKISEDPTYYGCRYCAYRELCHLGDVSKIERNCRTCTSATAKPDGTWFCEHHGRTLSVEEQRAGCSAHLYLPTLLPWEPVDASEAPRWIEYRRADGSVVKDGEGRLWETS